MSWYIGGVVIVAVLAFAISKVLTRGEGAPVFWSSQAEPSIDEMLREVKRLKASKAQWPEILTALNPTANRRIDAILQRLRGPHLFTPHIALNVVKTGCIEARNKNSDAGYKMAMEEALKSWEKIGSAGN